MSSGASSPKPPPPPPPTSAAIRAAREALLARAAVGQPRSISSLPNSALVDRDYEQDIELKRLYARAVIIGLGAQLAVADVLVFLYAGLGVGWKVNTTVLQVWLGATVIEVIGVVLVVTRYLFPRRDASGRS